MNDETIIQPITASESGKNAYYLSCKIAEHMPAYCSCLDKIKRVTAKDKEAAHFADCAYAIRRNTCPAQALRSEEVVMGKALYFVPRVAFTAIVSDGSGPVVGDVAPDNKARRRPAAPSRPAPDLSEGNYADAINAAMKAAPVMALPIAAAPVRHHAPPAMVAGESPMQYARRIAALR